jgi:hypothetical protein
MLEFKGWLAKDKDVYDNQISLYRIKPKKWISGYPKSTDINYDSLPENELPLNAFKANGLKAGDCKRVLITITEIE